MGSANAAAPIWAIETRSHLTEPWALWTIRSSSKSADLAPNVRMTDNLPREAWITGDNRNWRDVTSLRFLRGSAQGVGHIFA
jgi:hypothetical protein